MTLLLFAGLTATVFITRKDFSFLGPILAIGGMVALGFIVLSIVFGFNLGILFSAIMILFASGAILYSTSNILHQYRADQHVAASLSASSVSNLINSGDASRTFTISGGTLERHSSKAIRNIMKLKPWL